VTLRLISYVNSSVWIYKEGYRAPSQKKCILVWLPTFLFYLLELSVKHTCLVLCSTTCLFVFRSRILSTLILSHRSHSYLLILSPTITAHWHSRQYCRCQVWLYARELQMCWHGTYCFTSSSSDYVV